jgi:hypothetical protein
MPSRRRHTSAYGVGIQAGYLCPIPSPGYLGTASTDGWATTRPVRVTTWPWQEPCRRRTAQCGGSPLDLVAQRPDPALERGEVIAKACDALVLGAYEAHVGGQGRTQTLQRTIELPCELLRQSGVQVLA